MAKFPNAITIFFAIFFLFFANVQKSFSIGDEYLIFSLKYKTNINGVLNEVEKIGYYKLYSNGSVDIDYFLFDANKNLKPAQTERLNEPLMASDANYPVCQQRPKIQIPQPFSNNHFTGTWTQDGNNLKIQIGIVIYEWDLQDAALQSYILNPDRSLYDVNTGSHTINGVEYSESQGFAFRGSNIAQSQNQITRDNLVSGYYRGDYYQQNRTVNNKWIYRNNLLRINYFSSFSDSNILNYFQPCPYYDENLVYHDVWCQTTLLLNYSPVYKASSIANYIFMQGGHDYNRNGCLDETVHESLLLGILDSDNKIRNMVFAEYSYENAYLPDDPPLGYPLMNIGRYKEAVSTDPVISLKTPVTGEKWGKGNTYGITWKAYNAVSSDYYIGKISLWHGPYFVKDIFEGNWVENSYKWTVDSNLDNRPDYKIQVFLYKNGAPISASFSGDIQIGDFPPDSIPPLGPVGIIVG